MPFARGAAVGARGGAVGVVSPQGGLARARLEARLEARLHNVGLGLLPTHLRECLL